jgi:hypothetical protein
MPGAAGNNIRIRFNGTPSNELINPPTTSVTSVVVSGTDITVNYYPTENLLSVEVVKLALQTNAQANALVEMIILPNVTPEGVFLGDPFWPDTFTPLSISNTAPSTGNAVLGSDGSVTSVTITNPGSGFISAPSVTFGGAPIGGTTATGLAVVGSNGSVVSVAITNPGSGYITTPSVTFGATPFGGTTATGAAVVSKPISDRKILLDNQAFKLRWNNPYNKVSQAALYNENEALKKRYVNAALAYFEPIDRYDYPGRLADNNPGTTPKYENTDDGKASYIFDKIYTKVPNGTIVYSWDLYRNATAQYTSTETITIDGETVTTTIPVTVYDVLYPQNPLNVPPISVLSFYEKEEIANSDKRNIKVIRPEVINRFSKTYFDLLNT